MPLHYGKAFAFIAILTVVAFILWQLWVAFFVGETVEQPSIPDQGSLPTLHAPLAG